MSHVRGLGVNGRMCVCYLFYHIASQQQQPLLLESFESGAKVDSKRCHTGDDDDDREWPSASCACNDNTRVGHMLTHVIVDDEDNINTRARVNKGPQKEQRVATGGGV